jgi:hypothetical protein
MQEKDYYIGLLIGNKDQITPLQNYELVLNVENTAEVSGGRVRWVNTWLLLAWSSINVLPVILYLINLNQTVG